MNTSDFGIPQHRPRIYFIGIRVDAALPHVAAASIAALEGLAELRLRQRHGMEPAAFADFLERCQLPVVDNVFEGPTAADADCTCGTRSSCNLHECRCLMCRREGPDAMKCVWRRGQKKSVQSLAFKGC